MNNEEAANDKKATLGCGSLILIALIVLIFSNSGSEDLEGVKKELMELEKAIENQSLEIKKLRDSLAP